MSQNIGGRRLAFEEMRNLNLPWRAVLHLGERRTVSKGQQVPLGSHLYFLEQGCARLSMQNLDGVEKILWYVREGCIFGETPYFEEKPSEGYFICTEHSVIYAFSEEHLRVVRSEFPDLLLNLARSMAYKMRVFFHQAASMYLDTVLVRTCKFLAQRIVPGSEPLTANVGISRQEMASLLGVHRISLYKILRQQEENGLLGPFENKRVVILRPDDFFRIVGK